MPLKSTGQDRSQLWFPFESLPERDVRYRFHGVAYKPHLEAGKDNNIGTAASLPSLKCQRIHECLSSIELALHYILECNHLVVDFREQYWYGDEDELLAARERNGGRIPRNMLPSYDYVVTYCRQPRSSEFEYQAISAKLFDDLSKPEFLRRRERDIADAAGTNWKFSMFTERNINPVVLSNCIHLVKANQYTDIYAQAGRALEYAHELQRLRRLRTFEDELERMAKRSGVDVNESLSLFATGVIHGFIAFDFKREWDMKRPLAFKE